MYPLGNRKAFGLDLLDTVTYFLRPHIVTPQAHRIGQAIAAKQAARALAVAEQGIKQGRMGAEQAQVETTAKEAPKKRHSP